MRLQFKDQRYQTEAVDAVVDCFAGQPKSNPVGYTIDPGRDPNGQMRMNADAGLRNAEIALGQAQVLENIERVQRAAKLPVSPQLASSAAAPAGVPNLDVEMETGTGKTYVYIKTIMELHQRYGWSKFIIVVPSVAIREGVKKSFDITADHFLERYGTRPRSFIYSSTQLNELETFSSDAGIQVMIINIQAFNARGKDQRRIYDELDDFQSRRPIDVIRANRPIVIIDEPQKIDGKPGKPSKSLTSLAQFEPLMLLRYSATHRVPHDKVHRLDAVDAYQQKLVKKIAVRGITVRGLAGATAYLYLDSIELRGGGEPRARIELEVQQKSAIKRQAMWVTKGSNLHDLSNGIEAYKPDGQPLFVTDIDAVADTIELSNGDVVMAGDLADTDVTEESKRRIQIREVIAAHLAKERQLFPQGIKVLSLFFIDEVAKYRDYAREDTLGDYARVFEEEYRSAVDELLGEIALEPGTASYQEYLKRHDTRAVHQGYFSIDKKSNHWVNPKQKKTGDDKGLSDDVGAYDLILKDKERLLSLGEPVRFIFSHSALREGWDNPNVFTMGMLKHSDNTISRRQEIGRGLRIAVDQDGERADDPATVHQINELTVVTDESYTAFVDGLQKEIAETLSARPREAKPEFFAGREVTDPATGAAREITLDEAKQLQHWLIKNDFVDYDHRLTDAWKDRAELPEMPEMPPALQPYFYQVAELVDALDAEVPIDNGRRRKENPLNRRNFERREFQELWGRINHKAVYQVEFDSDELVRNCVAALDQQLRVSAMHYVVQAGEQRGDWDADDLTAKQTFEAQRSTTHSEKRSIDSQVRYDLLDEIADKTQLTRRTVAAMMGGVSGATFAKYRQNPEQFIIEAARIVNEQKATVIVEHLAYHTLSDTFDTAIFTENQAGLDLRHADKKLDKHIYDYLDADSAVERRFAEALDTSNEVAVYAKLPRGFAIPTPVGDYNPDWAIAFNRGSVKHLYFVAETKGDLSSMQLRKSEETKIECAKRFFHQLAQQSADDVTYDVVHYDTVASYADLMQLVG